MAANIRWVVPLSLPLRSLHNLRHKVNPIVISNLDGNHGGLVDLSIISNMATLLGSHCNYCLGSSLSSVFFLTGKVKRADKIIHT